MNSSKGLILLVLTLSVLFTFSLIIYIPSSTAYSPYNPYSDGISFFMDKYDARAYYTDYSLEDVSTIILILEDNPHNISKYINFLEDGGNLIILDNEGYSNTISSEIGAGIVVYNSTVLDEVYKYRERSNVKADVSIGNYSIVLYKPGYIEVSEPGVDILAISSIYSYVDMDGGGNYTVGEPIGSRVLAVRYRYGNGYITIVSSKSLICNEYIGLNSRFLDELVGGGRVIIDLSTVRHTSIDSLKLYIDTLGAGWGRRYLYAAILMILSVVGIIVWRETLE